jgi:hypothetical protein
MRTYGINPLIMKIWIRILAPRPIRKCSDRYLKFVTIQTDRQTVEP